MNRYFLISCTDERRDRFQLTIETDGDFPSETYIKTVAKDSVGNLGYDMIFEFKSEQDYLDFMK